VSVSLEGGPTTVLASAPIVNPGTFGPGMVATDGVNVYFAAMDGTRSVPLAGGPARMLTAHTGAAALVGSNLLVADSSAGAIFSVPIGGGQASTIVSNLSGSLGPLIACDTGLCWGSGSVSGALIPQSSGAITELGPTGVPTTIVDFGPVYRLAFDGTYFFASTLADGLGALIVVPLAGGAEFGTNNATGFAVDDDCVYIADVGSDSIYSISKSSLTDAGP
jgi:hypothetical protein